ncbi:alpha/beta hydrolase [Vibrio mediterranei]|uniref:alpha/beta hydrolase n=1 Tax=Vibrio mediterranei TaxID=689 RepID=UPI001EFD3D20|nr:alpha/beta hydrolase [Vibrio mediterranei]MCG9627313.1 alpha/beta hydrolase [Vibrio mediterranei]
MKNKRLATLLLTCFAAMNFGCNQQGSSEPNLSTGAPMVSAESTYLVLVENVYGLNRYDSNDPELFMTHGTENDPITPYSEAVELQDIYNDLGIYNRLETLEGYGHGAWNAQVDGKGLSELSFDFLVNRLNLTVQ